MYDTMRVKAFCMVQNCFEHLPGAFKKLRKATVNFVWFVCLCVRPFVLRMEQLGSQWTDFD
jgi:hypothetical protein